MSPELSFKVFRFLRKEPTILGRLFFAFSFFLLSYFASLSFSLSSQMAKEAKNGADRVILIRRIAWFIRRSWIKLRIGGKAHSFDFTQGMSPELLTQTDRFIGKGLHRNGLVHTTADQLAVAARQLVQDPKDADVQERFQKLSDILLSKIELPDASSVKLQTPPKVLLGSKSKAIQALRAATEIFLELDTPLFVISGTFLGLYRDNGFLPHDYDIDLGIMADDLKIAEILGAIHAADDFVLVRSDIEQPFRGSEHKVPRAMLVKFRHRNGVPIDLFFHYTTDAGEVVHGSSIHHWFNSPFDVTEYKIEGVPVSAPLDAERYLNENYGDWRTPVTDFDCTTGTPNLRIVRQPISIAHFLRRLSKAHLEGSTDLVKLSYELIQQGLIERTESGGIRLVSGVLR